MLTSIRFNLLSFVILIGALFINASAAEAQIHALRATVEITVAKNNVVITTLSPSVVIDATLAKNDRISIPLQVTRSVSYVKTSSVILSATASGRPSLTTDLTPAQATEGFSAALEFILKDNALPGVNLQVSISRIASFKSISAANQTVTMPIFTQADAALSLHQGTQVFMVKDYKVTTKTVFAPASFKEQFSSIDKAAEAGSFKGF
jgi:hypothetical protein